MRKLLFCFIFDKFFFGFFIVLMGMVRKLLFVIALGNCVVVFVVRSVRVVVECNNEGMVFSVCV